MQELLLHNLGIIQGKSYRVLEDHLSSLLKKHGLIIPEWKLLGLLYDNSQLKISKIADLLSVEGSFITRLVHGLEKRGLVTRASKKDDLRIQLIELKPETRILIEQIEAEVRILINQLLAETTKEQKSAYVFVLRKIIENGGKLEIVNQVS